MLYVYLGRGIYSDVLQQGQLQQQGFDPQQQQQQDFMQQQQPPEAFGGHGAGTEDMED